MESKIDYSFDSARTEPYAGGAKTKRQRVNSNDSQRTKSTQNSDEREATVRTQIVARALCHTDRVFGYLRPFKIENFGN